MTDFDIDSAALEAAMKERWGDPEKIADLLPTPPVKETPEDEPVELDLGLEDESTEDEGTDDESEEEEGDELPPTPPASIVERPDDLIPVGDGRFVRRDQLAYYANIDAQLAQDKAFREYVQAYGKEPPKPAIPAELDLDDPTTKVLWDRLQEMERRLAQTGQVVTQSQQQQQEELANRTVSLVNRAAASFQKEHELTDDQMKQLRIAAAHVGGVDSYMSGVHPVTGDVIKNPDIMGAIDTALTIAFRAREDFVTESTEKVVRRQLSNNQRKTRLKKIAGNSGSAPRTPQVPTDAPGRRAAMLEEVRTLMSGQ